MSVSFGLSTKVSPRRHVLDLDDFGPEELDNVLTLADAMAEVLSRPIKRVPTLRGRTVVTLFYEPSTRTRVSFELAAKALSADVVSLAAQTSSAAKGESLANTLRTLQALGADLLVMRHPQAGAPYLAAQEVDMGIINAGDGAHAHPTQALLDIYTIRQHREQIGGLKVVIVGDILHSRVARSNLWGLSALGAQVVLCGPPTMIPTAWNAALNPSEGGCARPWEGAPPVAVEFSLDRALEGADVVMPLRLQRERQEGGLLPSLREYARLYQVNAQRLSRAKPDCLVMHPGPMNEGIEISPEVAHGPHSVVEEQVRHGVAVRMALLYLLLEGQS